MANVYTYRVKIQNPKGGYIWNDTITEKESKIPKLRKQIEKSYPPKKGFKISIKRHVS